MNADTAPADTLRFEPPVSGPAYGRIYKLLLLVCLVALGAWGARLALQPEVTLKSSLALWALCGYFAVLYMGIVLLRSTTTVGPQTLSQVWFWRKEVPLAAISDARLMRWRGLEWLVAPRLYVRAGPGPWIGYHGASPELWAAFESIARARTGGL